jgi:hypothetical protein
MSVNKVVMVNNEIADLITKEVNSLIGNSPTFLNKYFINNGYCFEIAESMSSVKNIGVCSVAAMEFNDKFKQEMLASLSDDVNVEAIFKIITRSHHEWVFDVKNKVHFDAEASLGVKHLDDIPVFSRAIAKSVLIGNANVGGQWTAAFSQKIIDAIPFLAIDGMVDSELGINSADIKHIRANLKLVSQSALKEFVGENDFFRSL